MYDVSYRGQQIFGEQIMCHAVFVPMYIRLVVGTFISFRKQMSIIQHCKWLLLMILVLQRYNPFDTQNQANSAFHPLGVDKWVVGCNTCINSF